MITTNVTLPKVLNLNFYRFKHYLIFKDNTVKNRFILYLFEFEPATFHLSQNGSMTVRHRYNKVMQPTKYIFDIDDNTQTNWNTPKSAHISFKFKDYADLLVYNNFTLSIEDTYYKYNPMPIDGVTPAPILKFPPLPTDLSDGNTYKNYILLQNEDNLFEHTLYVLKDEPKDFKLTGTTNLNIQFLDNEEKHIQMQRYRFTQNDSAWTPPFSIYSFKAEALNQRTEYNNFDMIKSGLSHIEKLPYTEDGLSAGSFTGWSNRSYGTCYYANSIKCEERTGWFWLDDNIYFLDNANKWARVENSFKKIQGGTYYFDKNGVMLTGPGHNINGEIYDFDEYGKLLSSYSENIFKAGEGLSVDKKIIDKLEKYYRTDLTVKNEVDSGGTCIFAFEGLGSYEGEGNDYHPDGMYGAMMLVTKGNEITYMTKNASTLSDWAWKDKATLKNGVYSYNTGVHNQTYTGLRHDSTPKILCWYGQDNGTFKEKLGEGINIHAAGINRADLSKNPWSDGCQIVRWNDYVKFGKAVGFLKESAQDITAGDSEIINELGTAHAQDVNVTYVLDRSELPVNQINMFYPDEE